MLLKLALVVGVEIHAPVAFGNLLEPGVDKNGTTRGWHVQVSPSGHPIENYDFDMIVGADGKRNSLTGKHINSLFNMAELEIIIINYYHPQCL